MKWVKVENRWLNFSTITEIYIFKSYKGDDQSYIINFSCLDDLDGDRLFRKEFKTEKEAQIYLDCFMHDVFDEKGISEKEEP